MSEKKRKPSFKPLPVEADTLPMDDADDVATKKTGRVKFDDRGNALWEWAMATGAFGADSSTARLRTLENPNLSLAHDAPTPVETVRPNPLGAKKGYDPYDSGRLSKAQAKRKKDLRRLSEWLKLKKQAEQNKQKKDDPEE